MPERFKVVLDHARRYISARLYLYLHSFTKRDEISTSSGYNDGSIAVKEMGASDDSVSFLASTLKRNGGIL